MLRPPAALALVAVVALDDVDVDEKEWFASQGSSLVPSAEANPTSLPGAFCLTAMTACSVRSQKKLAEAQGQEMEGQEGEGEAGRRRGGEGRGKGVGGCESGGRWGGEGACR